jgi:hypothetical protein
VFGAAFLRKVYDFALSCGQTLYRTRADTYTWIYSVVAVIVVPCFPIFVEFAKNNLVDKTTFVLTNAIFSGAFLFTAGNKLCRAIYFFMFVICVIIYSMTVGDEAAMNPNFAATLDKYAGWALLGVSVVQSAERFWWHVVEKRTFPGA